MAPIRHDRLEFKFLINEAKREKLVADLRDHLSADRHADDRGGYTLRSLYFDNADRDAYWDRVRDLPSRSRLRLRVYGTSGNDTRRASFLEIKHKHFGRIVKRRTSLAVREALALADGKLNGGASSRSARIFADEVRRMVERNRLKPACLIGYRREAFTGRADDALRVTFDSDIGYRLDDLDPEAVNGGFEKGILRDDLCVMEIKTADVVPGWLRDALEKFALRPMGFSKYCRAIETAGGILPRGHACRIEKAGREGPA